MARGSRISLESMQILFRIEMTRPLAFQTRKQIRTRRPAREKPRCKARGVVEGVQRKVCPGDVKRRYRKCRPNYLAPMPRHEAKGRRHGPDEHASIYPRAAAAHGHLGAENEQRPLWPLVTQAMKNAVDGWRIKAKGRNEPRQRANEGQQDPCQQRGVEKIRRPQT